MYIYYSLRSFREISHAVTLIWPDMLTHVHQKCGKVTRQLKNWASLRLQTLHGCMFLAVGYADALQCFKFKRQTNSIQKWRRPKMSWRLRTMGVRLGFKLPGARVNTRNDCGNDRKFSNPAWGACSTKMCFKIVRRVLWNSPMQTSLWRESLTKPSLWRMIEVSDSDLARLTALTFPMADGPFGMWVQLVLQYAWSAGGLGEVSTWWSFSLI